jgi:hypothetical protein
MAKIEDLIAHIADERLQKAIALEQYLRHLRKAEGRLSGVNTA